jgi:hypothetical protein
MFRHALGTSALVLGLLVAGTQAQEPDTKAAGAAADAWLSLVDAANYAQSWETATTATTLPGAPDGQYVVFDFDATYENKAAAAERVTVVREKDGSWRAVGYYIK